METDSHYSGGAQIMEQRLKLLEQQIQNQTSIITNQQILIDKQVQLVEKTSALLTQVSDQQQKKSKYDRDDPWTSSVIDTFMPHRGEKQTYANTTDNDPQQSESISNTCNLKSIDNFARRGTFV
jgi:hypothetical protein